MNLLIPSLTTWWSRSFYDPHLADEKDFQYPKVTELTSGKLITLHSVYLFFTIIIPDKNCEYPLLLIKWGFPGGSDSKESACNAGDLDLSPGLGRFPGEGNGYPLHYSCLENSIDRGA